MENTALYVSCNASIPFFLKKLHTKSAMVQWKNKHASEKMGEAKKEKISSLVFLEERPGDTQQDLAVFVLAEANCWW